jgi:hypothetical protein
VRILIIEDRFGLISTRVPKMFSPKLIVKNFARPAVEFLRKCENPKAFPLPPSELEAPNLEGFRLNVCFRLFYTDIENFNKPMSIVDFKVMESPSVEFEMQFLAGKVPFVDISRVYTYLLKEK